MHMQINHCILNTNSQVIADKDTINLRFRYDSDALKWKSKFKKGETEIYDHVGRF